MSSLEVRSLAVAFGGVKAVRDIDLVVEPGCLVGLIGPNGAGKTTTLDAINGVVRASGSIRLDGIELNQMRPDQRARRGLARVWQSTELFSELTVRENIVLTAEVVTWRRALRDLAWITPDRERLGSEHAIELLGLADLLGVTPPALSHGQQKLVGVARACASGAKVLLLDEPAAGLDRQESRRLGVCLREMVGLDVSILLVEHDVELVMSVCDVIYVLNWGEVIARGTPNEIRSNERVQRAYLGEVSTTGVGRSR